VDAGALTPPDAIVALRSFPRRFRALVPPGDGTDDEHDRERRAAAQRAAMSAAAAIEATTSDLRRVLIDDGPDLGGAPTGAGPGGVGAGGVGAGGDAVGRVAAAATALADLAGAQPASVWTRTGRRGGTTVTAADLLREAVDAAARELRAAPADPDADADEG